MTHISRRHTEIGPTLIFALAVLASALVGFNNALSTDGGTDLFAGQQVLRGIPPYVSIFQAKGPVGQLTAAAGVALGRLLGLSDVYGVRLLFGLLVCLATVGMYLLAEHLSASRRVAWFSALTFLGFLPFTLGGVGGPEPKVPMLFFVMLSLYLTCQRRWLWAGLCGGLAAIAWQVTIVYPLATLFLAILQPRARRARAILLTLIGGALSVLVVVAYFAERKALFDLFDGAILFPLLFLSRVRTISAALQHIAGVIGSNYRAMAAPIAVGFIVACGLWLWRVARYRSLKDLREDRWAPLTLTFIFPILWSLRDFQGAPDFFVFLPYVTLGFSLFADWALPRLEGAGGRRTLAHAMTLVVCIWLAGTAALTNRSARSTELMAQERAAQTILQRFGPDVRIISSGAPAVLALTHRNGPTPTVYPQLSGAYDAHLEARHPSGYLGWLKQVEVYDPQLVVLGKAPGKAGRRFKLWLDKYYTAEAMGPWTMYVKKDAAAEPAGGAYAGRLWRDSATLQYLQAHSPDIQRAVYSDAPDILELLPGLKNARTPQALYSTASRWRSSVRHAPCQLRDALRPAPAYLILFQERLFPQQKEVDLNALSQVARLQPIRQFQDGTLYDVTFLVPPCR